MAYSDNELFNDNLPGVGSGLRFFPTHTMPKTFAAGSGTIAKGSPVMFNTVTDKWVMWSNDDGTGTEAGVIAGFVWPDAITLDSDEEVLGQVMLNGLLHYDDIPLPDGESADDLAEACRTQLREKGLNIQGLDGVR